MGHQLGGPVPVNKTILRMMISNMTRTLLTLEKGFWTMKIRITPS